MKLHWYIPFWVSVFLLTGCIGCNPVGDSLVSEGAPGKQPLSLDDTVTNSVII